MVKRIIRNLFLLILFLPIITCAKDDMSITMIDLNGVGGDSVLLESNGEYLLMDTFSKSDDSALINYLVEHNIFNFSIYISHYHEDHYGGLISLLNDNRFTIKKIYLPKTQYFCKYYNIDQNDSDPYFYKHYQYLKARFDLILQKNIPYEFLWPTNSSYSASEHCFDLEENIYKDRIVIGNATIKVIGPVGDYNLDTFASEGTAIKTKGNWYINTNSLVSIVSSGNVKFLTAGDTTKYEEEKLISQKANYLQADIMKLSHHGHNTSNTLSFVKKVNPKYIFAMRGDNLNTSTFDHLLVPETGCSTGCYKGTNAFVGVFNGPTTFQVDGSDINVTPTKNYKTITFQYYDNSNQSLIKTKKYRFWVGKNYYLDDSYKSISGYAIKSYDKSVAESGVMQNDITYKVYVEKSNPKYNLEDFVYFDPVTTQKCNEKNYWTYYNQNTTCYRFLVLSKDDDNTKDKVSLLLDHNLGYDTFANYPSILSSATSNWTRYTGTIDIPSENYIADLMQLGNNRPIIDSATGKTTYVNAGVTLPTMYTNIDFYVNGVEQVSRGYWLNGNYTDNSYAYAISQNGSNYLVPKTNKRGIRPMITVDKSLLSKMSITNISVPVRDNSVELKYSSPNPNSSHIGYNQLQGFTVANGALTFYSVKSDDTQNGLISSYSGNGYSTFRKEKFINAGHGNGMTYIPGEKKILVVGANDYKDIYELDAVTLDKEKTYNYNDESYNVIGYDRNDNKIVAYSHKRFYFFDRDFTQKSYSVDFTTLKIGQDIAYYNGYIYAVAYESDENSSYQLYHVNNEDTCKIYVINGKFKDDGTPDKDFGRVEKVLYIGNIQRTARPSDGKKGTGEIEGINFYGGKVILGYSAKEYDSNYPFKFYEMDVAGSSFEVSPNVSVSYNETETNTKVTLTATSQLKSMSGWTLSSDKYTLSKTVSDQISAENISVCDIYNNCKDITIKALNLKKQNVSFSSTTVNKQFHLGSYTLAATSNGNGAITYSSSDNSVATVDNAGKVVFKKVGQVIVTATAAKTDSYYMGTFSYVLNITKGTQELSFDSTQVNKYVTDDSFAVIANHSVGDGTVTYSSSNPNVATVDNVGKVTIVGSGSTIITATATETSNYHSIAASYTLNVLKNNQELSFGISDVSKKYGDSSFTMIANHPVGDGDVTYSSSDNSVATVDNSGTVVIVGVGTVTITATAAETGSYFVASASYVLTVSKASQKLTFNVSTVSKRPGDSSFTIAANHAVGDGDVTYSSSNKNVAIVDNSGKVTIVGIGTTTIKAQASETEYYNSVVTSYSLIVESKDVQELSFSVSTVNKKYGNSDFTVSAICTVGDGAITYSSSNPNVATVDNSGKVTIIGVGTTTITATAAETNTYASAAASYSLNVAKGSQVLSFPSSSVNKKYGDLFFTLSAIHSVGDGIVTYSTSDPTIALVDNNGKVTIVGVGTVTITATASATSHYKAASASYSLNVEQKNVQELSFPKSIVNKKYGDSNYTIVANHAVGDGDVTYSSSNTNVATVDNSGTVTIVGVGTATITATAAETSDYSSSSASYSLNVDKSNQLLSFPVSSVNKTEGDSPFSIIVTHSVGDGTVTYSSSDMNVATVDNSGRVTIIGLGTATITAKASSTSHYKAAAASYSLNVSTKSAQNMSFPFSNVDKEYGDSSFTVSVAHPVGDGAITYSSSNPNVATVDNSGNVIIVGVGMTTITATAAETSDYSSSSASYSLNVAKGSQELSFPISTINKKYGELFFTIGATHSVGDGTVTYSTSNPTVALVDDVGKVTIVGVGTATITATASSTEHYKAAAASYSLNVGTKTAQVLSFPFSVVEKEYGDSDYVMIANQSIGDGTITYSSSDMNVATVDNSGKVTIVGVGTATIMATAAETSDYSSSSASYSLNVSKGSQELSFAISTINKKLGDLFFTVSATQSVGDGTVTYSTSNPTVALVDNSGKVTIVGLGTTTIIATATETSNYKEASASYSLNVGSKTAQVLSFPESIVNKKYGDADYTMSVNHLVGDGTITYSSSNESIATVDNSGKVMLFGAGTVTIIATASETPSYAASSISYTLNVGKGIQKLEFAELAVNKRYGDADYTMVVTHPVGDGTITYSSSDTSVATVDNSGKVTIVGVGTTTIIAIAAETSNYSSVSGSYTLSVSKRSQTISFSESTINKIYGDEDYVIAAIHTVGDGEVTYSSSDVNVAVVDNTGKVTIKNAGTTIITVTAAGTATCEASSASYALNVAKASQSISIVDVSTNGVVKKIDDEPFSVHVVAGVDKSLLSYSSSNENVAIIDNNGLVTIVGEGETILIVTVLETENYAASNASVLLKVQSIDSNNDTTEEIIENIPNTFLNSPFTLLTGILGILMILSGFVCFIKFRKC